MKYLKTLIHINTTVASGCTAYFIMSHTLLADMWKKALGLKINNEEVPVPKKVLSLIDNVIKDLRYSEANKPIIKPIMITGIDLKHWGYSGFKPGAFLGIPQYFIFENKMQVEITPMIGSVKVHPTPAQYMTFKDSFFLSENAKKFALVREISESNHFSFYPLAVLPLVIVSFINLYYGSVLKKPTEKGKKILALLRYQVILLGVCFYIFLLNVTSVYKQGWADFEAAKLGKNYIEGGLEYYQKLLNRNKAIKEINENSPYTDDGDINTSWIRNKMPISRRIKYLNDILRTIESKDKQPSVWDYVPLFKQYEDN